MPMANGGKSVQGADRADIVPPTRALNFSSIYSKQTFLDKNIQIDTMGIRKRSQSREHSMKNLAFGLYNFTYTDEGEYPASRRASCNTSIWGEPD
jgi:hypothetical protein